MSLTALLLVKTFSKTVSCMFEMEWPLRLKWAPVASGFWSVLELFLFNLLTYPRCCANLSEIGFSVVPMYCC